MVKKTFFVILIFLIFCSSVNAIVVSDLTEQIKVGNEEIIASNAKTQIEISNVRDKLAGLEVGMTALNDRMLTRGDLEEFYNSVDLRLIENTKLNLVINILTILFALLLVYLSKAKGWL